MAKRQRRSSRSLRGAPSAFATFHDHIEDAQLLVDCARAFDNQRVRRARRELRERFGEALRVKRSDWDALDIVQSSSMAAVFLPASPLGRTRLADLRRLLRPAVVAAAAAVETHPDWERTKEPWIFEHETVFQQRAPSHDSLVAKLRGTPPLPSKPH